MSTGPVLVVDQVRADGGVEQAVEPAAPPGTPRADDDHRGVDGSDQMGQRAVRRPAR